MARNMREFNESAIQELKKASQDQCESDGACGLFDFDGVESMAGKTVEPQND